MTNPKISELEARIKDDSKNLEDYLNLGKIYLDNGEYNKLLELYEKTSTLSFTNGGRSRIMYEKGQALDFLGKKKEAISCYEQSLDLLSNEQELNSILDIKGLDHYNLSLLLDNEMKGYEQAKLALEEFKELLKKYPDYEEKCMIYSHLAELYCRFNEFEEAIDAYEKAVEISQNDEQKMWGLTGIASVYRDKGDYRKSEESYNQALILAKEKKYLSKINYEIGRMYFESDRIHNAIEAFNNALKYRENDLLLRYNSEYIADIYWHLGSSVYYNNDYDKTIEYLNKALENINENHMYFCNTQITLGHCYLAKGNYSKAQEYYNRALFSPLASEEEIKMANECLKGIEKEREV